MSVISRMEHATAIYRRLPGQMAAVQQYVDAEAPARVVVWPSSGIEHPDSYVPRSMTEFWLLRQTAYRSRGLEAWARACEQMIRSLRSSPRFTSATSRPNAD